MSDNTGPTFETAGAILETIAEQYTLTVSHGTALVRHRCGHHQRYPGPAMMTHVVAHMLLHWTLCRRGNDQPE